MVEINVKDITDDFVIHYGGKLHSVEANTFANSLVAITRIFEETNYLFNPDFQVEVRIEALAEGSFRPKINLITKSIQAKISPYTPDKKSLLPIVISIFALQSPSPNHVTNQNNITIHGNGNSITMPIET